MKATFVNHFQKCSAMFGGRAFDEKGSFDF